MLKSLYISSFVIIDKMKIDFESGMSVLTGETGAGKSIVIDALGQLCGDRASTSFVKKNCSKATIEGVFDVTMTETLKNIFDELHLEQDDQLVITKEIYDTGKSNVKINYQNASNNVLKMIMPYFIDIHSQFETQKLFEEKNHIALLDEYASNELQVVKDEYNELYNHYKEATLKLKNAVEEDMSDEQLDFLQSQLDEINEVAYNDDEINSFEEEVKMLQNFEKVNEHIETFEQLISSSNGSLPTMKEALSHIHAISEYGKFSQSYDNMYNLYYNFMDEYELVLDEYRSFHFDEYRFNELQ
ncbi:MAG: AAA family ATPase, partial [Coprobacillus sp.]